jgi:peptidoglycan hydrolase-like protein with peptidoglycan-binding domain
MFERREAITIEGGTDMRKNYSIAMHCALLALAVGIAGPAFADELTQKIQKDLVILGYEPGNTDGESTDLTVAAIAQFQAERDMPVTGEVSPLLAGIISAEVSKKGNANAAAGTTAAAPAPVQDPAVLRAAQQACLQQKVNEAQAANKKKRGIGRLLSAVSRTASQAGNYDLARTTGEIYSAGATASDLSAAAKDLGVTEDDISDCQNPM